jgi:branched-chain amino acid transport system substrate-binding protein
VLAVLVVAVLLSGCPPKTPEGGTPGPSPASTSAPAKTGAAPAGEPIKIGAILSVTGPSAPLGVPEQACAQMLEKQINDSGGVSGRPIKIIIEDDASEEAKAVLAAKKLIDQDKVCAIIGPTVSGTTLAIADSCDKAGIPLISCAASVKITQPVKKFVFSTAQTDVLAVGRIVPFLKDKKFTKVALICDSNAFGQSGAEQLKRQLPAAGVTIVDEEKFGTKDTQMTAQLTKIKAANPQAIICWGTNPGPAVVTKNAKTLGIKAQLIMSHGSANPDYIKLAGADAEGIVMPCGKIIVADELAASDPQKTVLEKFKADFEKSAGKPPTTFAGHVYDAVEILLPVLKTAGEDKAKIRDGIEATKDFAGIGGLFNLSATDHNGLKPDAFTLVTVKGGKFTTAK